MQDGVATLKVSERRGPEGGKGPWHMGVRNETDTITQSEVPPVL